MANLAAPSGWTESLPRPEPGRRLGLLGYALLVYTVQVLLFGALVRVTGSGAGCGQHWPTCQGEILHLPQRFETVLELSHRVTSGLVLVFGFGFAWLLRKLPAGHRSRKALWVGLSFTLLDALIGAVLVLGRLVGENSSPLRALVMPVHLVSTCGLTAGFALSAFWARESGPVPAAARGPVRSALFAFLGAFVMVAAMGAVTALGDTLYPVSQSSLAGRVGEDLGSSSHFLQQLRVVHPLLAVSFGLAVIFLLPRVTRHAGALAQRFATASVGLAVLELGLGVLNVVLSAPAWMQLVHLGVAVVLWLGLVLTAAETLAPRHAAALRARAAS
jgi:heme A synthase